MYVVRIESFCNNVNILYASTVAFMKVTSFSLVWGMPVNHHHHSSLKEKRDSIITDALTKMLQYSIRIIR